MARQQATSRPFDAQTARRILALAARGTEMPPPEAPERLPAPNPGLLTPDLDAGGAITGPFKQPERSFQSQVVRYARLMGWAVYHTHDSRRSAAGFPDLVLVRRPRVVWAELKSQRGKTTPAQDAWIAELRACDQEVFVWRPSDWKIVERVLR